MKVAKIKRLPVLLLSAAVLLFSTGAAYAADTTARPYLKTYGSDVMTGGWFNNGNACSTDSGSNYQSPNYNSKADSRNGGILTYSKSSGTSAGGDSSQYAAYSAGDIDGPGSTIYGFYSAGAQAAAGGSGSTPVKALTFANTGALSFGGDFEGSIPQSNCVPDYYSKMPAGALPPVNNLDSVLGRGSGIYSDSAGAGSVFTLTDGAGGKDFWIEPGERITIYIKGNVYIDGNIKYRPTATVDSVPKFALIVKGSIYIDKDVTELDGMYVAQPTSTATVTSDDGLIWTCHPNNTAVLDYTYPPTCTQPLVVNGALIAKQINFLRVRGNITGASTNEDKMTSGNCGYAVLNGTAVSDASCANISEIVNYTPATIMGGSFFNDSTTATTGGLPIDGIISLPPVF